jgi:hypothetical protein
VRTVKYSLIVILLAIAGVALLFFTPWSPDDTFTRMVFVTGAGIALLLAVVRFQHVIWRKRAWSAVASIEDKHVEVWEGEPELERASVRRLGGRRDWMMPWILKFATPDDRSLARVLEGLRDLGVPFYEDDRSGPSPMMVFDELRKKGLVSGATPRVGGGYPKRP